MDFTPQMLEVPQWWGSGWTLHERGICWSLAFVDWECFVGLLGFGFMVRQQDMTLALSQFQRDAFLSWATTGQKETERNWPFRSKNCFFERGQETKNAGISHWMDTFGAFCPLKISLAACLVNRIVRSSWGLFLLNCQGRATFKFWPPWHVGTITAAPPWYSESLWNNLSPDFVRVFNWWKCKPLGRSQRCDFFSLWILWKEVDPTPALS